MKRAKSLMDTVDQRDIEGIKGLEALSARSFTGFDVPSAADESPESLPKAKQHFESELKASVELLERKRSSSRFGGLPPHLAKRPYGLVNKVKDDLWKCIDGTVFPTSHQAYSHIRALKEHRKQQQEDSPRLFMAEETTPPLKRRKKDLELHEKLVAQTRQIFGTEVDFSQVKPSPQMYLLARHWFYSSVEGIASGAHPFSRERESLHPHHHQHQHQQQQQEPWSLLPSPEKVKAQTPQPQLSPRLPRLPRVTEVLINSQQDQTAAQLLGGHKARWAKRSLA